ncbi:MAG: hypothetical protein ACYSWY_08925 [Planctomycetota bacterium]|jgi:hypothetical protein
MSWVTEHIINPPMFILIGAFIAAAGAFWASLEQAKFERVLRTKSDEIAQLNTKIASAVTGGDSFCYLDLAIGDGTTNTPALMLVHQGEYPVYDVSVRIVDCGPSKVQCCEEEFNIRNDGRNPNRTTCGECKSSSGIYVG